MNPLSKVIGLLLLALFSVTGTLHAQEYPNRAVRVVVAYPPGGPTDVLARLIVHKLSESMGQQFIIDNRGGGNGIIGTEAVAKSQPDGYTLLFGTSSLASNGSLYPKLPYDAAKDLSPITLAASTPYFLVVNAGVPAHSVEELIRLAKEKPGQLNFASAGNGAGTHLAGEKFSLEAGIDLVHVPYRGTGPAVTDLIGGRVQIMFVGLPAVLEQVNAGALRLLAVAEPQRSPLVPDLPTVSEAGVPGYEFAAWFGLFGPAGMPEQARQVLAQETARLMQSDSDLHHRITALGAVPLWSTPAEFEAYFGKEQERYQRLIRDAGITLE